MMLSRASCLEMAEILSKDTNRAKTNIKYFRSSSAFFVNPFMPSGLFYHNSLDRSISYIRGVWLGFFLLLLSYFIDISELNANSVDPDQTPRSALFAYVTFTGRQA